MVTASSRSRSRALLPLLIGAVAVVIAALVWLIVVLAQPAASEPTDAAPQSVIPADTAMGPVELSVSNLDSMRAFYVDAVGLDVLSEDEDQTVLGLETPLITLSEGSGGAQASFDEAGLYHSAILYPDAPALAETLMNLATVAPESFQGSADHAVSEAFYFVDPEGNGLELYIDRAEDEWVWQDGEVQMGSEMLDVNAFISEHLGAESAGATELGHVHLKVGDLQEAEAFYADTLGFAVTARSDGALFYSAGGYHHHLATNTWQTDGASARSNATGLGAFTVVVPTVEAVNDIADRLGAAGFGFERGDASLSTTDPWGNTVHVTVGR